MFFVILMEKTKKETFYEFKFRFAVLKKANNFGFHVALS